MRRVTPILAEVNLQEADNEIIQSILVWARSVPDQGQIRAIVTAECMAVCGDYETNMYLHF